MLVENAREFGWQPLSIYFGLYGGKEIWVAFEDEAPSIYRMEVTFLCTFGRGQTCIVLITLILWWIFLTWLGIGEFVGFLGSLL